MNEFYFNRFLVSNSLDNIFRPCVDQKHGFFFYSPFFSLLLLLLLAPYISLHFFNFTCHLTYTRWKPYSSIPPPPSCISSIDSSRTRLFAPCRVPFSPVFRARNGVKLFRFFIPSSLIGHIIPLPRFARFSRCRETKCSVYPSQQVFFSFFFFKCSRKIYESGSMRRNYQD